MTEAPTEYLPQATHRLKRAYEDASVARDRASSEAARAEKTWHSAKEAYNEARQELGLPPVA